MNTKQLYDTIKTLAQSQGAYGRMLRDLDNAQPDEKENWLAQFTYCKTPVDFILALEG